MKTGLVLKTTGSRVEVESEGEVISCRMRGQLRLKEISSTNPVAVGDKVEFDMEADGTGMIHSIGDRSNYIARKSIKL